MFHGFDGCSVIQFVARHGELSIVERIVVIRCGSRWCVYILEWVVMSRAIGEGSCLLELLSNSRDGIVDWNRRGNRSVVVVAGRLDARFGCIVYIDISVGT
jgi:hypothetical protein